MTVENQRQEFFDYFFALKKVKERDSETSPESQNPLSKLNLIINKNKNVKLNTYHVKLKKKPYFKILILLIAYRLSLIAYRLSLIAYRLSLIAYSLHKGKIKAG